MNRRRLHAIDDEIKLSKDIHGLKGNLERTVFILDACDVGSHVEAFRSAFGALGMIGFSRSVDWVDAAVFVLALLRHMQSNGIFQQSTSSSHDIKSLVKELRRGAYNPSPTHLALRSPGPDVGTYPHLSGRPDFHTCTASQPTYRAELRGLGCGICAQ